MSAEGPARELTLYGLPSNGLHFQTCLKIFTYKFTNQKKFCQTTSSFFFLKIWCLQYCLSTPRQVVFKHKCSSS